MTVPQHEGMLTLDVNGMKRWSCRACNWNTLDPEAARRHFDSASHHATAYLMTKDERIEDLLALKEELRT